MLTERKPQHYPSFKERAAIRFALGCRGNSNVKISVDTSDLEKINQAPQIEGHAAHYTIKGYPGRYTWSYLEGWRVLVDDSGPNLIHSNPTITLPQRRGSNLYTYHQSTRRILLGKVWLGIWRDWQEEFPERDIAEFLKHP